MYIIFTELIVYQVTCTFDEQCINKFTLSLGLNP